MRDFQEFIDKKIAVSFEDEKERDLFLNKCHENKLECFYGGASYLKRLNVSDAITMNFNGEYLLQHASTEFYESEGYDIVPAAEFLTQSTPTIEFLTQSTPTIEIFQSEQTVVCLKKQGNKVVAVGKAKCNPEDVFDFEFGASLAFDRMRGLKPLVVAPVEDKTDDGIKTLKNGMKIRKQDKYEVGDRVLIKKKCNRNYGKEHYGKTATIVEAKTNFFKIFGYVLDIDSKFFWFDADIKGKVIE